MGSLFLSIALAFLNVVGVDAIEAQPPATLPVFETIRKVEVKSSSLSALEEVSEKPLKVNIFDSFHCEDCNVFVEKSLPLLRVYLREMDNVNLRVYFNPDPENEEVMGAVMSVKCAEDQGKFWEMHHALHTQKTDSFSGMAKKLGMDVAAFNDCVSDGKYAEAIADDITYANYRQVRHLPTVDIGSYQLIGPQPIENFEWILNKAAHD